MVCIRYERVGRTLPINSLAWVVWHLLTPAAASNGICLIEGLDAVLFKRKGSPENKKPGLRPAAQGDQVNGKEPINKG